MLCCRYHQHQHELAGAFEEEAIQMHSFTVAHQSEGELLWSGSHLQTRQALINLLTW